MKGVRWTAAEDAILRRMYRTAGDAATSAMLPGRTVTAIRNRASEIGCALRPVWSESEDKRLLMLWESGKLLQTIAEELQRPMHGVYIRALKLGLKPGAPQGFEYLYAAVQRTGFNCTDQLRRVLNWAGVRVHRSLSQPKTRLSRWHHHYVDPTLVDEAVARWVRSETIAEAARRYGISDIIMRKWLLRAGVIDQRSKRGGPRRVDQAVVDRVMVERNRALARLELLGKKAARVEVVINTLEAA